MNKSKSLVTIIQMSCKDRGKTESFYSALGVDVNNMGGAELDLYFMDESEMVSSAKTVITIQCEDLKAILDIVDKAGLQVITPFTIAPWGATMIIADPDGRQIVLTESVENFSKHFSQG